MKKYEYHTEFFHAKGLWGGKIDEKEFNQELNNLGADGWELVGISATTYSEANGRFIVCVLKREVE